MSKLTNCEQVNLGFFLESNQEAATYLSAEEELLRTVIFANLHQRHPWFDIAAVVYFDASTFCVVLERCSLAGVQIAGLEIFTENGKLLAIEHAPAGDNLWCMGVVQQHSSRPGILLSATYLFNQPDKAGTGARDDQGGYEAYRSDCSR